MRRKLVVAGDDGGDVVFVMVNDQESQYGCATNNQRT